MTRDETRSADYLIDWRSWRGPKQFGWHELSAPRWWPRGERARFPLLFVTALAVKTRFALFPPTPDVTEDDVDEAELEALLDEMLGTLPMELAPAGQRAGAVRVGFSVDPDADLTPAQRLVAERGVRVRADHWSDGFALHPVDVLAWQPSFGGFSTVDGLVGRGFDAYARILHPIEKRDGDITRLRWSALPDARLDEPGWRPDRRPDGSIDFDFESERGVELVEGVIPEPERRVIHQLLRDDLRRRADASRIVQGIWAGIGGLGVEGATQCRIDQPEREIVPFTGAFDEIVLVDDWHTVSIVYPESGAWCLANDTDLVSTYLAAEASLAQRFLDDPRLECLVVGPENQVG